MKEITRRDITIESETNDQKEMVQPRKYAFIDAQNTETTTLKVLGFEIDWMKLHNYLINEWHCEKVFFYPGIQFGDEIRDGVFNELIDNGASVVPKYYHVYRTKDKIINHTCVNCQTNQAVRVEMGNNWKCNCDVELTVDVLSQALEGTEIFLFSGDGDFEYLINAILDKGGKVAIVSSGKKIRKGKTYFGSRLSTKLRKLSNDKSEQVKILEINNLKNKIQK